MVKFLLIVGNVEARVITWSEPKLKSIVSPAAAAVMALRKVFTPESAPLVTTMVAAFSTPGTNITMNIKEKCRAKVFKTLEFFIKRHLNTSKLHLRNQRSGSEVNAINLKEKLR